MGRGLSDLQKDLLRMAYQHRLRWDEDMAIQVGAMVYVANMYPLNMSDGNPDPRQRKVKIPDDLHVYEAMVALFDCVEKNPNVTRVPSGRRMNRFGGQHVSVEKTGRSRYRAASASISRALARLEQRGLVTRVWPSAITLTDQGLEAAKGLTVGSNDVITSSNR